MFDFKFDWDSSINTGIDFIDSQHKELFRIGRDIEQLLIARCIGVKDETLLQIVCELRDYVAYHFYHEERLMEMYNFEGIEEHKKEHKMFTEIIMSIDCPKLGEQPFDELKKIKDIITQIVFNHMIKMDQVMGEELVRKMQEHETLPL